MGGCDVIVICRARHVALAMELTLQGRGWGFLSRLDLCRSPIIPHSRISDISAVSRTVLQRGARIRPRHGTTRLTEWIEPITPLHPDLVSMITELLDELNDFGSVVVH